ncbi:MAG: histidine ammonia-lyase [Candidatus Marinimicrobia bacterium]|nr:histidine ammonia-lyase [Candidatus Neomarinimicrobiota bacterium]
MDEFPIDTTDYSLSDFKRFVKQHPPVVLTGEARGRLARSRAALETILQESSEPIYGINTGFGKLSQVRIEPDHLARLQLNLIRSHAVGVGPPLELEVVRLTMLLKLICFSQGHSGVRLIMAELLVACLNHDILACIPSQGSVGASGDLAPLAHLALALVGEGQVDFKGRQPLAVEALAACGLKPLELQAKEGLAMINGTQVSTALGLQAALRLDNLIKVADIVGALTLDGLLGTPAPFTPQVHALKRHAGQKDCAANLRTLLEGSTIRESHRHSSHRVQDIYSLRCMPQIHGACRDTIGFATSQVVNEANSVSDNPLIFPDSGEVVSAGHFHGEAVAMACDMAAIAAAELGNISERRIFALMGGSYGLPPFLVSKAGLNSGLMMFQVTAAALASENKTLAHPACVDSIPTGADQEDHVPMATWAGRKLASVISNLEQILALEYLAACQALDFREGLHSGPAALGAFRLLREQVDFLEEDRPMAGDIQGAAELIGSGAVVAAVEKVAALK